MERKPNQQNQTRPPKLRDKNDLAGMGSQFNSSGMHGATLEIDSYGTPRQTAQAKQPALPPGKPYDAYGRPVNNTCPSSVQQPQQSNQLSDSLRNETTARWLRNGHDSLPAWIGHGGR